ncbi:hypothetical protein EDC01DRAFT_628430 [Geopyxis carbonaria]|nr:hypothetical protein EDC01DRAFT_628430 [Geopyxis carbonaria]
MLGCRLFSVLVAATTAAARAQAAVGGYGQCGGLTWSGGTACESGWHCEKLNDYYSQCLPGGGSSASTSASTTTSPTSSSTTTTTSAPIPSSTGTGPGSTLLAGYYWIRAVAAPNFHKYLQSSPPLTASPAVLEAPATAGQFQVTSGQLVQLLDSAGTLLYGHVAERADSSVMKLQLSWDAAPATYGSFAFSGDTLTWTHASITRPNSAAFLVCESQHVYINLGAYAYLTPEGCSDQTIHYYNGATANE